MGENLEFGYSKANGEWLTHMGDDDLLIEKIFTFLDKAIDDNPYIEVIRAQYIRYYWHNYKIKELANTIDPFTDFNCNLSLFSGEEYIQRMINNFNVFPGGSWFVSNKLISKISLKNSYYISAKHVEFYSSRIACANAATVAELSVPSIIIGRHEKSTGTQVFGKKSESTVEDFSWDNENKEGWTHCPFSANIYTTLSYDAALKVVEDCDYLTELDIDNGSWLFFIFRDLITLESKGRTKESWWKDFVEKLSLYKKKDITKMIKISINFLLVINQKKKNELLKILEGKNIIYEEILNLLRELYLIDAETKEKVFNAEISSIELNTNESVNQTIDPNKKQFEINKSYKNIFLNNYTSSLYRHYLERVNVKNITDVPKFLYSSNVNFNSPFYDISNVRLFLPNLFLDIESKFNVNELLIKDINIWPILKFYITSNISKTFEKRLKFNPRIEQTNQEKYL